MTDTAASAPPTDETPPQLAPSGFCRRRAFWAALRPWLWLTPLLWLTEELWLWVSRRPEEGANAWRALWLAGLPAGYFTTGLGALALGVVVSALWAWSVGPQSSSAVLRGGLRAVGGWLFTGTPAEQAPRVVRLTTVVSLAAIFSGLFIALARETITRVVRPMNAALVLLFVVLGLALVSLLLAPLVRRLMSALIRLVSRVPGLRVLTRRAGYVLTLLVSGLLLGALVVLVTSWHRLAVLPWGKGVTLLLGGALAALMSWFHARVLWPRCSARLVLTLLFLGSWLGAFASGLALRQASEPTRLAMSDGLTVGQLGYRILSLALDVDGDGAPLGFGGSDCAPFDAT